MADTYDPLGIAGDSTPIGTDCGGHAVSQEEETWGENEDLQPVCDNCGTHFCTEVDAGIDLRYMDDLEAQKAEDVQQLEEEEENLPEPDIVELDTPVGEIESGHGARDAC
jgi:hypothetical protein